MGKDRQERLGKFIYLYSLGQRPAVQIAVSIEAQIDKDLFPDYKSEIYSERYIESFIDCVLCAKGKHDVLFSNGKRIKAPLFWGNDLLQWAAYSSDIDNYMKCARAANPRRCYSPLSPVENPFRINEIQQRMAQFPYFIIDLIYCIFLDTSMVNLNDAIRFLRDNNYQIPTHQLYDNNPFNGLSYDDFIQEYNLTSTVPKPQGGSRPETDKIIKTEEYCLKVFEAHIKNKYSPNTCHQNDFVDMVESAMCAGQAGDLFQKSAARKFFKTFPPLVPYKKTRGRTPKAKK